MCVEDEIEKYHLHNQNGNCWGLNAEVLSYKLWYEAYVDNNINGFSLPITVDSNDEYRRMLELKLREYVEYLNRPAFAYENGLLDCVETECRLILNALDSLINGNEQIAENVISDMSCSKETHF